MLMRRLRSAPKVLIPAILLGIGAFSGVIDLTQPPGPGLDPDALAYLGAAKSLASGHGLRVPSSSWESADTTALLVHSAILSEPLFLAILAVFTWLMSRERRGADTKRTLLLGALAVAATLIRYAGISLVAAVVVEAWWAVDGKWADTWKQRAKRAMIAAELPAFLLAVWMFTRPHSEGAEKIREMGLYTSGFGATLLGGAESARV